jgi:hypothetical protein
MSTYPAIIITDYDDLSESEIDLLRNQSVDLDDWDLMIFFKSSNCLYDKEGCLIDWQLQKLFDNNIDDVKIQQDIKFKNDSWYLGIRYH